MMTDATEYTECLDCPAKFKPWGKKERCGPCSETHREREKQRRREDKQASQKR